jgi:hypothetical protein
LTYPKQLRVGRLKVEDAVKDERAFGAALQTLCRMPVVFVDGTDITPAMALLLGIRAVVRRGVTLFFRVEKINLEAWQQLIFSLRELRVIEITDRASLASEEPLAVALEEGLRRYARNPFDYADLPAFDALRNLGPHEDDISSKPPDKEVLLLCPFDKDFEELCWPQIQRVIQEHFRPDQVTSSAKRVIDLDSPEILSRRLFTSIRRDTNCVIDLTRRKVNVFFELGIRLAANPLGARIIRCADLEDTGNHHQSTRDIETLVGTKTYEIIEKENDPAKDAQASLASAMQLTESVWPGGLVAANYTYLVAQRCVFVRQEGGGHEMLEFLWRAVESLGGKDRQRQSDYPVFYGQNPKVRAQTVRFLVEGLAAYLLLAAELLPKHEDGVRRTIALADLRILLLEMDVSESDSERLSALIDKLEKHHEN